MPVGDGEGHRLFVADRDLAAGLVVGDLVEDRESSEPEVALERFLNGVARARVGVQLDARCGAPEGGSEPSTRMGANALEVWIEPLER